ncbi:hypothetical protein FYK55_27870 [Roseiconus nitratireducens]|uniref:Uncharacterized protein n=1 Tax=Roseiconus nitratireducens TaxID=2605748 RepID=A0A5M6CRQ6_9BACT|nr:hypothetical protein [Roseiconus nitratireducens]KAA5537998.1 hypothetical protein FYK55_27870 [Roseiconus nitratireducens]
MKRFLLMVFLVTPLSGCGSSNPESVAEGISQSDFDEYNRLVQESQAQMEQSDAAQRAYDANPQKKTP